MCSFWCFTLILWAELDSLQNMQREPLQDVNGQGTQAPAAIGASPAKPIQTAAPASQHPAQPAASAAAAATAGTNQPGDAPAASAPAPSQTEGAAADAAAVQPQQPGQSAVVVPLEPASGAASKPTSNAQAAVQGQAGCIEQGSAAPAAAVGTAEHLAGNKRPAPSSVTAGCKMQRPPRHAAADADGVDATAAAASESGTPAAGQPCSAVAAAGSNEPAVAAAVAAAAAAAAAASAHLAGKKRPAPSSVTAGCKMQRPPRHAAADGDSSDATAAAAGDSGTPAAGQVGDAGAAAGAAATAAGQDQANPKGDLTGSAAEQGSEEQQAEEEEEEEEEEEAAWQELLWNALCAAAPPTRFACSGRLDQQPLPFLCPEVTVAGVGRLGLPLSREQAATLKAVAEQAPHGKGLRTVVDTAVRDAQQVDASQVTIGSSWGPVLARAVAEVSQQLGLSDHSGGDSPSVEARLYKLLLYEQGGHFAAHQDTEKERGMIGTLVVQLPCAGGHTGGSLRIRHKDRSHTHHFAEGSDRTLQYAAFFADCEHELSPVTSGMRLVLVYNLVWVGAPGGAPRLYRRSPAEVELTRALKAWEADLADGGTQRRIAVLLEHEYTDANLGFEHLKGTDRGMARALATCPSLDAHLVLVTRTVSGGAEWSGRCGWKRRRRYEGSSKEEDEGGHHDMTEVYDTNTETGSWVAPDGSKFHFGSIDEEEDFYEPNDNPLFASDDEPDEENYEGYTGNAGPTVDHIYHRALLVIWPRSQSLCYAKAAGLPALLSVLKRRVADAEAQRHASRSSSQQRGRSQAGAARSSSSSRAFRAAAEHLAAALAACVQQLEQQQGHSIHQQLTGPSYRFQQTPIISTVEGIRTVLQQGVRAAELGVEGARQSLLRLIASVASRQPGLLAGIGLPALLAKAAGVLDPAAVGPLLEQFVAKCMLSCPNACIELMAGLGGAAELQQQVASAAIAAAGTAAAAVDPLLLLAVAMPGLPGIQQQAVHRLVHAVQEDSTAEIAEQVVVLLPRLNGWPHLQQPLASAAAARLIAAGPIQHLSCVLLLIQVCEAQQQQQQQQQGELQLQLVDAVVAALRSPAVATFQASTFAPALMTLQAHPKLSLQLQAAMADGIFAHASLLAGQTDDSMLQLCAAVLSAEQTREKHFAAFAAAVAQRPNNQALLQLLLARLPPDLMQRVMEAVIAAVRATAGSSSSSSSGGSVSLQVCGWEPVVRALRVAAAGLAQQLCCAVVETVCADSALLSAQSEASMLSLSQLLIEDSTLQAAHWECFAPAVVQRPDSAGLLLRLLQSRPVQASAPAQEQLVAAAAAALRTRSSTWQVSGQMQLTAALRATPALCKRLEAAIAECVFTKPSLLAAQSEGSLLDLSTLLLGNPQLRAAYYDLFAAAVARHQGKYQLLQRLLASQPVKQALDLPEVQQLVACQVANLQRLSAEPAFSWEMPQAVVPSSVVNSQQVQAFLRGPAQSYTLRGFTGIADARSAARALLGLGTSRYYSSYNPAPSRSSADVTSYSINAVAGGTGRNAYVSITKTQDWHARRVQSKQVYKNELQAVMALRR